MLTSTVIDSSLSSSSSLMSKQKLQQNIIEESVKENSETHNFVTHSICSRLLPQQLWSPAQPPPHLPGLGPRSQQNKNCKRLHFNTLERFSFWEMKSFDACSNSNAFVTLSIWSRDYYLNNDLLELFILRLILLLLAAGSLGPQTNTEKGCILYSWTILFRGIKSSTHNLMLTTVSLLWFSFSEASLRLLRLGPQTNKLQKITRFYREHQLLYELNITVWVGLKARARTIGPLPSLLCDLDWPGQLTTYSHVTQPPPPPLSIIASGRRRWAHASCARPPCGAHCSSETQQKDQNLLKL